MKTNDIARVVHEANRAYSQTIFDYSSRPWADTAPEIMNSTITGVEFLLRNPDVSPSLIHEHWVSERKKNGWKWGPRENLETKEHPNMMDYDRLSPEEQVKDRIFIAVIKAIADEPKP